MFITSGGVQYIGSTSGGYHEYIGRYHEYIRGVQYIGHEYIGRCSVPQGDTMSTSVGYHEYIGGHHEYIGGCSVHRGFQ